MGQLLSYAISSGIVLLALYIIYKWVLANENQCRFNRAIIWAIYAVSFALFPAFGIFWTKPEDGLSSLEIAAGAPMIVEADHTAYIRGLVWQAVLIVYIVGAALTILLTIGTFVRLVRLVRRGKRIPCDGYTLVLADERGVAPFSWMRFVVMTSADYEADGEVIIAHERQHIRCAHWVDLLFAQLAVIIGWFNPAVWLMREELRAVHEYQADSSVVASGFDARSYQMLLIKKAVGARFPSLANSLNHSKLKKRITMMNNQSSSASRRVRALALLPALALAVLATDIPCVASAIDASAATTLSISDNKGSENSVNDKINLLLDTMAGDSVAAASSPDKTVYYVDGVRVENLDGVESSQIANMNVDKSQDGVTTVTITTKPAQTGVPESMMQMKARLLSFVGTDIKDITVEISGVDVLTVSNAVFNNGEEEIPFDSMNLTKDGESFKLDLHSSTPIPQSSDKKCTLMFDTNFGKVAIPIKFGK